jgi:hypothetical protein
MDTIQSEGDMTAPAAAAYNKIKIKKSIVFCCIDLWASNLKMCPAAAVCPPSEIRTHSIL